IGGAARFRSVLEQLAFSRGSLRRSRCRFFAILYVPSARVYSGGVHLLPHLCRHHVPASVRGALALSSNPPSRHEKLIHSRNANIRCSPFTSVSPQERTFGQCPRL